MGTLLTVESSAVRLTVESSAVDGDTLKVSTTPEKSVTSMITSFTTFSKPIPKTSSMGFGNIKVIVPLSLAWAAAWFTDWTISTLPIAGIPLGTASSGVPVFVLPGLAVSKRRA
jgi:hypothetical protein